METLPVELLRPILRLAADVWPFIETPFSITVYCAVCSTAPDIDKWSLMKCATPSIQPANFPPHSACHTMRLGFVNLTHVCSLWRTIVIAMTHLWTDINSYAPADCVRAFSSRSGDKPLSVKWDRALAGQSDNHEAMLFSIQSMHTRVHKLDTTEEILGRHASALRHFPLSNLQSLALHNYGNSGADILDALQAWNLQELTLEAGPGDLNEVWSFFDLSNLRRLSLDFANVSNGIESDSLPGILESLRHCEIPELCLQGLSAIAGFDLERELFQTLEPVHMGHCTVLELSGDQSIVDDLVSLLIVRPLTTIKLAGTLNRWSVEQSPITGVLRILAQDDGPGQIPFTSFTFDVHAHASSGLPIYSEEWKLKASHNRPSEPGYHDDFTIILGDTAADINPWFKIASEALPRIFALFGGGVRELALLQDEASRTVSPQTYHDCFASWALVEQLRITGTVAAHNVVDGLLLRTTNGDQRSLLPQLRVLELAGVEWENVREDMGDALGTKLVQALRQRSEAGVPLEMLTVTDIDALRASMWWDQLRDVVRVVD